MSHDIEACVGKIGLELRICTLEGCSSFVRVLLGALFVRSRLYRTKSIVLLYCCVNFFLAELFFIKGMLHIYVALHSL